MQADFQRQLQDGSYKSNKDFISNEGNLKKIIHYVHKAAANEQCLNLIFNLIKFFRFPLALCCEPYYHTLNKASPNTIETLKPVLNDLAAYVKSLVKEMEIAIFPEIEFFFKWGQAGKRFKINIVNEEKEFGKFIIEMSNLKKELVAMSAKGLTEDLDQKIKQFLGMELEKPNVFQRSCVEYMKNSCGKIIKQIYDRPVEQPVKRGKRMEPVEEGSSSISYNGKPSSMTKNEIMDESSLSSDQSFQNGTSSASWSVKPICCRTSFQKDEVIQQPQSLRIQYKFYSFPFNNHPDQIPSKEEKIKKTICGFLNGEGGSIYFGIKEMNESKKRVVWGMILSEQRKKDFSAKIVKLIGEVLPDVGKKFAIKYVPIKNAKGNFISGSYIAKLVIERGHKANVYSYQTTRSDGTRVEKFAFRTENEVLQISEIQRVLKIFKNKIESPERTFYPTHPGQCPQPQMGKPLYDHSDYDSSSEEQDPKYRKSERSEAPCKQQKREFSTWQEQQQFNKRKKFMQKNSSDVLIHQFKQDVNIALQRMCIKASFSLSVDEQEQWTYIQLQKSSDFRKISSHFRNEVVNASTSISFHELTKDQLPVLDSIVDDFRQQSWKIIQDNDQQIVTFRTVINACKFYLKMLELGMKVSFFLS